jgi:hypothetical protein
MKKASAKIQDVKMLQLKVELNNEKHAILTVGTRQQQNN